MDLDLRKLRYFVAVAERLHFGQAAEALHITQPALSRQIRQLEHDVGVALFARTSREVALTPAGEQLLRDAGRLLAASHAVRDRARRAGEGGHHLTVGFMLGIDTAPALRRFAERHPDVIVHLKRLHSKDRSEALLDGRVDAGLVRLPLISDGLSTMFLYTEPFTVLLSADHPLAAKASLRLDDIADEPLLHYADADPAWNAFWRIDPRPDGTRPRSGPAVHDIEEIVEYVRVRRGVAFLPPSINFLFPRSDVVYVPVADAPPSTVVLAWESARHSPLITALAEVVRETVHPKR
ncbi:LysR substrate-binding domain-containing protein [Streptosporangium sp. NPDC002524]|uniref:LysR family transcriptional regulator n=1 Tax=Streptosporangium sp. NPDC002524 TaxID=3154537 RepID=UPI00331EA401